MAEASALLVTVLEARLSQRLKIREPRGRVLCMPLLRGSLNRD